MRIAVAKRRGQDTCKNFSLLYAHTTSPVMPAQKPAAELAVVSRSGDTVSPNFTIRLVLLISRDCKFLVWDAVTRASLPLKRILDWNNTATVSSDSKLLDTLRVSDDWVAEGDFHSQI